MFNITWKRVKNTIQTNCFQCFHNFNSYTGYGIFIRNAVLISHRYLTFTNISKFNILMTELFSDK